MKLAFVQLDKLCVSKLNMRYARKAPDVSDILPTVRARGVLQPIIVRPCGGAEGEAVGPARVLRARPGRPPRGAVLVTKSAQLSPTCA